MVEVGSISAELNPWTDPLRSAEHRAVLPDSWSSTHSPRVSSLCVRIPGVKRCPAGAETSTFSVISRIDSLMNRCESHNESLETLRLVSSQGLLMNTWPTQTAGAARCKLWPHLWGVHLNKGGNVGVHLTEHTEDHCCTCFIFQLREKDPNSKRF